ERSTLFPYTTLFRSERERERERRILIIMSGSEREGERKGVKEGVRGRERERVKEGVKEGVRGRERKQWQASRSATSFINNEINSLHFQLSFHLARVELAFLFPDRMATRRQQGM